ncbi:BOP1NT domain protein, partial [Teladorsagia circumcincta]
VEKLNNLASGKYPVVGYNPYEPFLDLFSSEKTIHPIDNRPEPKSRFIPSRDEMRIVSRMVHAIKMGWAKGPKPKPEKKVYDLWAAEDSMDHKTKSELARMRMHMPAPK